MAIRRRAPRTRTVRTPPTPTRTATAAPSLRRQAQERLKQARATPAPTARKAAPNPRLALEAQKKLADAARLRGVNATTNTARKQSVQQAKVGLANDEKAIRQLQQRAAAAAKRQPVTYATTGAAAKKDIAGKSRQMQREQQMPKGTIGVSTGEEAIKRQREQQKQALDMSKTAAPRYANKGGVMASKKAKAK